MQVAKNGGAGIDSISTTGGLAFIANAGLSVATSLKWINGTSGTKPAHGYRDYDVMGRVVKESNVTEVNATFVPAGDDQTANNSFAVSTQTFDWKGRPLVTTHPDGTSKTASYEGCGCAGGEVVILTDEVGQKQKVYADVLGRRWKSQILNMNGSPYSTTVNIYDVRDQLKTVTEYAGDVGSVSSQDTMMDYDGYGRLKSRKATEQTSPTTFSYNADDTLHVQTDARGATTTYVYNNRHLATSISYGGGFAAPAVTLGYDGAGNRISMSDGMGSISYSYDRMSRLSSETRTFSALNRSYTLSYEYTLSGNLKKLTGPFGNSISYTRDSTGQLGSVTGSSFGGVTEYVSAIHYRAWGAVKSATYGNDSSSTITYNNRLQPTQFRLTNNTYGMNLLREDYTYNGDGRLLTLTDLDDTPGINPPSTLRFLTRSYEYDQAGRVTKGYGESNGPTGTRYPYTQTYGYDAFGNMTSRAGSYYSQPSQSQVSTYTNNRRDGWTYNADGDVESSPATSTDAARAMTYDAAGRMVSAVDTTATATSTYNTAYDGDGQATYEFGQSPGLPTSIVYNLRSTVLKGEIVTRLDENGNHKYTKVHAEGLLFATQVAGSPDSVTWTQRDALGITEKPGAFSNELAVYDPLGNYIPFQRPADPRPPIGSYGSSSSSGPTLHLANPDNYGMGCTVEGMPWNCSQALESTRALNVTDVEAHTMGIPAVTLAMLGIRELYETGTKIVSNWKKDRNEKVATLTRIGFVYVPGAQPSTVVNPQRPGAEKAQMLDVNKFAGCVNTIYGVTAVNIDTFADGPMRFSGTYEARTGKYEINLEADLSESSVQLGYWSTNSGPVASTTIDKAYWFQYAKPQIYIANEHVGTQGPFLQSLFVYELGNALHMITGNGQQPKDPGRYFDHNLSAKDVGGQLVDCVYGGKVEENNLISHPKRK
jgi:YD repeat-containing protein